MSTGSGDRPEPEPILRKPPGGAMRWLMKAPVYLNRAALGWMMDKTMATIQLHASAG